MKLNHSSKLRCKTALILFCSWVVLVVSSFPQTQPEVVELKIYNVLGRLVRTLVHEKRQSGNHYVDWDGRDNLGLPVASGQFFYQFAVGTAKSTRSMLLLQ